MGLVYVTMKVAGYRGRKRDVEFLVDSGASMTVLPESVWRALGLKAKRTLQFVLADGTPIQRRVSECRFFYQGIDVTSPVILGARKDSTLLGALTLESLGLVLNPFERTLRPMRMMLAAAS